ncbi:hypothetical protein HBI55_252390 [Parastagonospora nodorum]|nr:hypothetical protein HBH71_253950 [Parastagonospora nodorum]KAH6480968.1 hypothetical protein HBI55_252390 [Parastagonospora nodorum]
MSPVDICLHVTRIFGLKSSRWWLANISGRRGGLFSLATSEADPGAPPRELEAAPASLEVTVHRAMVRLRRTRSRPHNAANVRAIRFLSSVPPTLRCRLHDPTHSR